MKTLLLCVKERHLAAYTSLGNIVLVRLSVQIEDFIFEVKKQRVETEKVQKIIRQLKMRIAVRKLL